MKYNYYIYIYMHTYKWVVELWANGWPEIMEPMVETEKKRETETETK